MAVMQYDIVITTVGPVHIGNGSSYGKKDYFVDGGRVAVLDVPRFIEKLSSEQLAMYCDFLSRPERQSESLEGFLLEHKDMRGPAKGSIAYESELKLSQKRNGDYQYCEVATFLKDAYGCPYIPGSSIKGMLRTALLIYLVSEDRDSFARLYNSSDVRMRKAQQRACGRIEKAAFRSSSSGYVNGDAVNDALRFLSVADSESLSINDLAFVKKYDLFSNQDSGLHKKKMGRVKEGYFRGNELNIYRECLKPGTKITARLSIDDRINECLQLNSSFDGNFLANVLKHFYKLYSECFLSHFDIERDSQSSASNDGICQYVIQGGPFQGQRCKNRAIGDSGYCNTHQQYAFQGPAGSGSKAIVYLGGGVDFDSKTILNALFPSQGERVNEISRILYSQFPSRGEWTRFAALYKDICEAGFEPASFRAHGRSKKEDHRHWQDSSFGVSPHTLKLGIIGDKKFQMGKCEIEIRGL